MNMAQLIEDQIKSQLNVFDLIIVNESELHAGHAGDNGTGQTHFKLKVVSGDLASLPRVQGQRQVMSLLKPLFDKGLHAVSIHISAE